MVSPELKGEDQKVKLKVEKGEREISPDGLRGRKNHEREDVDVEEGRSNKQSAVYVEESELTDMFDKVLLSTKKLSLYVVTITMNLCRMKQARHCSQMGSRKELLVGRVVLRNRAK